ncbi:MAG TPA: HAD-IA family hydrolase [Ilumatobacteraceae bacterium]|nr:HAD-IA family hydrolase [Ilumatobacteraceae bacterium]
MTEPDRAPAAVLWDMDGTLVDTEPYWMACERELVDAHGGHWTEEDARSIIGFDLLDAAVVLRERGGVDLEPQEIVERMLDGVVARVREHVPWRPGARRLLSELNDLGVPCALVTMSWSRLVDAVVVELAPITFQAIVTGDNVRHGKPHPEPYLLAARRLGVEATECVAIEDSPTGVASAGAAGCVVVAVPNIVPIDPAPGRFVVPTLKEVSPHDLGRYLAETPPPATPPPTTSGAAGDRRRRAVIGGALAAIAVVAIAAAALGGGGDDDDDDTAPRVTGALDVHAWTPYWAIDDALPELPARAGTLHQLSPFWWRATGVDTIEVEANAPADETAAFLAAARERDIPLVASILDGTEAGVMAGILADPAQRARHVEAIAAFAADNELDGIDIDYEQFAFADGRDTWATTRPNWVAFVEELATVLHDDGRTLTVSIPPVYDAGQSDDSGYWVYDYGAIAPFVDAIRVMAYDYSVPSGEPGPVAPLPWVERVIAGTSAASGDPSKLVLGIPMYGYNWVVATNGTCPADAEGNISLSTRDMVDLAARRGATPQLVPGDVEMTFSYDLDVTDGAASCTQSRQVHYVNGEAAQIRMQRAVDAGFGGVALFAFGYEDQATWNAIDAISRALEPATTAAPGTTAAAG